MGLCVLYYVEYSLYNVKKVGFFYLGWNYTLNTGNTLKKVSNIASDEDIMENNYMFVMLWNLSIISHLIFLQCFFFFISGTKSINSLRG